MSAFCDSFSGQKKIDEEKLADADVVVNFGARYRLTCVNLVRIRTTTIAVLGCQIDAFQKAR